jgi:hypothetical protein
MSNVEKRYHYRMVCRLTLAELEQAVRHLEREDWELVMQDGAPTIQEALQITKPKSGLSNQVVVPMRREFTAAEYAENA